MRKMFAVFKREYLQAVRRKMFIIMTLILPFLMAGLMVLPGLMVAKGLGEKRIAVIDGSGQLREAFEREEGTPAPPTAKDAKKEAGDALAGRARPRDLPQYLRIEYVDARNAPSLDAVVAPYLKRVSTAKDDTKLDGALVVPRRGLDDEKAELKFYSRASADIVTQERLSRAANRALQRLRLGERGIDADEMELLMRELPIQAVQLSRSGEQKKGGELNFLFAFIFAALLIMPSFVYGNEIMRGVIQEKNDRVVEVLISSMRPLDLLTGKIVGVAAVGLTQISVWLLMFGLVGAFFASTVAMAGINVMQFIRPQLFLYFFIFFVLGYLTYVCVYAIAGSVCNSEREAQQLLMPIVMFMMAPWFLMFPIITNPDSALAVVFSMAPIFGPITMFVRTLVAEPPFSQVVLSILISVVTIAVFFYATAKIFRVGILSYGKRPTVPELLRWIRVA